MRRILRASQAIPLAAVLLVALAIALVLSLFLYLEPSAGFFPSFPLSEASSVIVFELRGPRAILAVCVGASLALCGASVQSVVRNPLAGPDVLGVSAGASFGALSLFLSTGEFGGHTSLAIGALLGAAAAGIFVFAVSRSKGRSNVFALLLAGMALSSLLSGMSAFLLTSSPEHRLSEYLFWILGSLENRRWEHVVFSVPVVLAGAIWATLRAGRFNAYALGDQTAASIGLDVERLKTETYVVVVVVTATCVCVSGAIGFLALLVPHAVRLLWGNDTRWLFLLSGMLGATFLVVADVVSRLVAYPYEIPVGIVTTIVGGPFFLLLLFRKKGRT